MCGLQSFVFIHIFVEKCGKMKENAIVQISDAALKQAASEGIDAFLKVFTDKYLDVIHGKLMRKPCICSTVTNIRC